MDSLRLTLILIGLGILVLIWVLHKPNGRARKPGATRREPSIERGSGRPEEDEPESAAEPDEPTGEPRQTQLPDLGSEAPDWSVDSPRRTDATRVRQSSRPGDDGEPQAKTEAAPASPERREPSIEPEPPPAAGVSDRVEPTWPGDEPDDRRSSDSPRERSPSSAAGGSARIVKLYLRARGERLISGLRLLDAAIKAGLRFGEMKIFHRRHQGADKPVFSMANIARPGSFDPAGWNLFETQGVTLFMTLPGPVSGLDAWDAMLATGQRLSELLDADLMDDSQCLLTRQRIAQIREDMREHDRKAGIGQ